MQHKIEHETLLFLGKSRWWGVVWVEYSVHHACIRWLFHTWKFWRFPCSQYGCNVWIAIWRQRHR